MFDPLFESHVAIFGIPAGIVVFGVAIAGLIVGLLWLRRITGGDPEPESFRATAPRRVGPSIALILGVALLGLVMMFLGATWVTIEGASQDADPSFTVQTWLLIGGAALEAVAIGLAVRRLWVRARA